MWGVGWGGGDKNEPAFFGSKIMNLLVFSILSLKSVSRSPHHGVRMGRGGTSRACSLCTFQPFFAMLAVLAISVTPWYPL